MRKVIQISAIHIPNENKEPTMVFALCDDGTMFSGEWCYMGSFDWIELPSIPQPEDKENKD